MEGDSNSIPGSYNMDDSIPQWSSEAISKQPHHERFPLCTTRPTYRQGRKLTAVKVYTVNEESQHILIRGVPALNLYREVKHLCRKYGEIKFLKVIKNYSDNEEQFTEVYHALFERIQSSRFAKHMMDDKSFYGGVLHVCYAPELESVTETRNKLISRKYDVLKRIRNTPNVQTMLHMSYDNSISQHRKTNFSNQYPDTSAVYSSSSNLVSNSFNKTQFSDQNSIARMDEVAEKKPSNSVYPELCFRGLSRKIQSGGHRKGVEKYNLPLNQKLLLRSNKPTLSSKAADVSSATDSSSSNTILTDSRVSVDKNSPQLASVRQKRSFPLELIPMQKLLLRSNKLTLSSKAADVSSATDSSSSNTILTDSRVSVDKNSSQLASVRQKRPFSLELIPTQVKRIKFHTVTTVPMSSNKTE